MEELILKILTILKVATARTIGKILAPLYKNEQTATVASQKELNFLVAKGDLKRGDHWYSVKSYEGSYNPHDKLITQCMAQLISLKYPISLYRERSLTGGIRPDIIGIIKKNGKALNFIVEICLTEEDAHLEKKAIFWQYHNPLEEVFGIKVPPPTLVVHGKTHAGFMAFDQFIKEVSNA
jgi:hypothetical protein